MPFGQLNLSVLQLGGSTSLGGVPPVMETGVHYYTSTELTDRAIGSRSFTTASQNWGWHWSPDGTQLFDRSVGGSLSIRNTTRPFDIAGLEDSVVTDTTSILNTKLNGFYTTPAGRRFMIGVANSFSSATSIVFKVADTGPVLSTTTTIAYIIQTAVTRSVIVRNNRIFALLNSGVIQEYTGLDLDSSTAADEKSGFIVLTAVPSNLVAASRIRDFDMSPDGRHIIQSSSTRNFYYYELSTPFQLDTTSSTRHTITRIEGLGNVTANQYGAQYNDDGTKAYYLNGTTYYEFDLSTPYDFRTAVYEHEQGVTAYASPRHRLDPFKDSGSSIRGQALVQVKHQGEESTTIELVNANSFDLTIPITYVDGRSTRALRMGVEPRDGSARLIHLEHNQLNPTQDEVWYLSPNAGVATQAGVDAIRASDLKVFVEGADQVLALRSADIVSVNAIASTPNIPSHYEVVTNHPLLRFIEHREQDTITAIHWGINLATEDNLLIGTNNSNWHKEPMDNDRYSQLVLFVDTNGDGTQTAFRLSEPTRIMPDDGNPPTEPPSGSDPDNYGPNYGQNY